MKNIILNNESDSLSLLKVANGWIVKVIRNKAPKTKVEEFREFVPIVGELLEKLFKLTNEFNKAGAEGILNDFSENFSMGKNIEDYSGDETFIFPDLEQALSFIEKYVA